ncbi:PQQ-binding-like beta-propeller repeat protein [Streptomyces sp. NBC_00287]|uniref:serine/threonine-protein kinase n=1 Tax=Streptomyces sp. NBC_00287 TaxID=2975702 RepID=UPI002E2A3B55|nr:serine/threonine-protein kinase [Streptomyces sp. NBC_00287]
MPLHKDDPKSVGGYKLVDRLGAGGMGVVYRGRSRSGREVAVKVVHAQYAADPVFRARFRQEIDAVRKVSGAFTAPVVDADPEAARPWMATQYVPGRSLAARIRDVGPLRDSELRRLALGLVEALREIHRAGVVHRDLKPANVLMADDGPRVIDFGISRATENITLTETGQMIGTPPFMSPEQLTDARSVGPSSDVFSLGALLVYTVTGRGPFDADSPYLTAYRVVHDAPVLDGVSEPLRAILERCLTKEAADRPELDELAREFVKALPEATAGDPETLTLRLSELRATADTHSRTFADPTATTHSGRRRSRIRPLLAATGTVGVAALGLTAYLLLGPGWADSGDRATPSPSATSRWAALPNGWKPWQTTLFETAPLGAKKALGVDEGWFAGEPDCLKNGDAVFCTGDSILPTRLDAGTGKTLWRSDVALTDSETESYSGTLLGFRDGTLVVSQVITTNSAEADPVHAVGFDAQTGEQLWKHQINEENLAIALSGGLVITSSGGRTVEARSPRTGEVRWTALMPTGHHCSFTPGGPDVYAHCTPAEAEDGDAVLLVLDAADGSERRLKAPYEAGILGVADGRLVLMQWAAQDAMSVEAPAIDRILLVDPDTGDRTTAKLTKSYEGEPTLAGGTVWFVADNGLVTAVSPRTGKELWRTQTSLEQPGDATYDARTRTLYLASISGRVAALDARKGTSLWETLPRAGASSGSVTGPRVLLHQGALIVPTPDGTVFNLDPAHPDRKPASG